MKRGVFFQKGLLYTKNFTLWAVCSKIGTISFYPHKKVTMTLIQKVREKALDGFLLSVFFITFTTIAYAAISWPSAPDGETAGGKYSSKLVPSGAVMAFNLASCPASWTECTDCRGKFLRALDNGAGLDTGRTLASTQAEAFKSHAHNGSTAAGGGAHTHDLPIGTLLIDGNGNAIGSYYGAWSTGYYQLATGAGNSAHSHTLTISSTGGTETRPTNIAFLYCIKG